MPKTIYVNNTILTKDKRFTYLSEDVVSAGTTIRVQSILGFESLGTSSGQIVCIGEIGNEKSEILRTSNSAALSSANQEVTLRDALGFNHPQDTKVFIIDWNRADFQWASTVAGTKQTLRAYPLGLMPDLPETQFIDTAQSSGFYFVRFNETIGNTNSDFSDAIPFAGFDDNTVWAIKKRALDSTNEKVDTDLITDDYLNTSLWEGRREYHNSPGKRPFRRKFDVAIGNVSTGMFRIVVPSDLQYPATSQNLFGVRIGGSTTGRSSENMNYIDKKQWDQFFQGVTNTTLDRAYTVGDKDLYCVNVRDFATTGVVSIAQTNVEYSAKGISGGTLRISVQGNYGSAAESDVWQNATYGLPDKFTVFETADGTFAIYFNRPVDTVYVSTNIFADYYRTLIPFDSDADVLDEPEYDMFVPWLSFKIKQRKNQGLQPLNDSDYQQWLVRKNNALANEYLATDIRIRPNVDHLPIS